MSSNEISNGRNALERLERWLASNPEIPQLRNRPNKAAICRIVGIARSTADANTHVRARIAGLNLEKAAAQEVAIAVISLQEPQAQKKLSSVCTEISQLADSYSLALEHLRNTGRVVR